MCYDRIQIYTCGHTHQIEDHCDRFLNYYQRYGRSVLCSFQEDRQYINHECSECEADRRSYRSSQGGQGGRRNSSPSTRRRRRRSSSGFMAETDREYLRHVNAGRRGEGERGRGARGRRPVLDSSSEPSDSDSSPEPVRYQGRYRPRERSPSISISPRERRRYRDVVSSDSDSESDGPVYRIGRSRSPIRERSHSRASRYGSARYRSPEPQHRRGYRSGRRPGFRDGWDFGDGWGGPVPHGRSDEDSDDELWRGMDGFRGLGGRRR